MKNLIKITVIIIFCFALNNTVFGQVYKAAVSSDNYLTKWKSTSGGDSIKNSLIYDNGTNVGIGITNPAAKLHIIGNAIFGSTDNIATGANSVAIGGGTKAIGNYSFSTGFNNTLPWITSGSYADFSTTMGFNTTATGKSSVALGFITTAQSYASLVIGRYNQIAGSTTSWVDTDPVFIIGNGTNAANTSNAMTVLKNGKVGIGTANPSEKLVVNGNINATGIVTGSSFSGTGQSTFENLQINKLIKVGNSINIGGTVTGATNKIFEDGNDLLIQSESAYNFNTIINANNSGKVSIGLTNPKAKLDLLSTVLQPDQYTEVPIFRITDNTGVLTLPPPPNYFSNIFEIRKFDVGLSDYYNVFTVTDTGMVGIGTSTPRGRLTVVGGASAGNNLSPFVVENNSYYFFAGANRQNGDYVDIGAYHVTNGWKNLVINRGGGNVGIGTTSPSEKLEVNGKVKVSDNIMLNGNWLCNDGDDEGVFVASNGDVGIGTTTLDHDYKLSVCGAIRATRVKVETSWCDYVFEKDYKLMPLTEVEKYIQDNKHLPGITKGATVESEGLDLGEMQAKQMEKIEEIILYLIELKKENAQLKEQITNLEQTQR